MQNHTTFVQAVEAVAEILEQISITTEDTPREEILAGLQEVITSCNLLINHLQAGNGLVEKIPIPDLVALIKAQAVIGRDTHGLTEVHIPTALLNQLLEV